MQIEFDPAKDIENRRKHGISLEAAVDFDLDGAWIVLDDREDYGEPRYRCIGFLQGRMYTLVMTPRHTAIRVISLRKANGQEQESYVENT